MILLVDIKSDAAETYTVLRDVLADYRDILTKFHDGNVTPGAVTVVISGNRATEMMAGESARLAGVDGRLDDLATGVSAQLMPLISDHWGRHFSWRGTGEMPAAEREKLRTLVQQAHEKGQRIRFWATPESPPLWSELLDAGVDLIGTDDLEKLSQFLDARRAVGQ